MERELRPLDLGPDPSSDSWNVRDEKDRVRSTANAVLCSVFACAVCNLMVVPPVYGCKINDRHLFCSDCLKLNWPCPIPRTTRDLKCGAPVYRRLTLDTVAGMLLEPPTKMSELERLMRYMLSSWPYYLVRVLRVMRMKIAQFQK